MALFNLKIVRTSFVDMVLVQIATTSIANFANTDIVLYKRFLVKMLMSWLRQALIILNHERMEWYFSFEF